MITIGTNGIALSMFVILRLARVGRHVSGSIYRYIFLKQHFVFGMNITYVLFDGSIDNIVLCLVFEFIGISGMTI